MLAGDCDACGGRGRPHCTPGSRTRGQLDGLLLREPHFTSARLDQHAVEVRRERGHSLSHAYSHVTTGPKVVRRHTLEQITGTAYQVLQLPVVGHITEREVR